MRTRFKEHVVPRLPQHGIELLGVLEAPTEDGRLTYLTAQDGRRSYEAWAAFGADASGAASSQPRSTARCWRIRLFGARPLRSAAQPSVSSGRTSTASGGKHETRSIRIYQATSVAEVCAMLAAADEDARVISGGQTHPNARDAYRASRTFDHIYRLQARADPRGRRYAGDQGDDVKFWSNAVQRCATFVRCWRKRCRGSVILRRAIGYRGWIRGPRIPLLKFRCCCHTRCRDKITNPDGVDYSCR
jgi:hypothetical protein